MRLLANQKRTGEVETVLRRDEEEETKWKGSKARDLGAGYKLYYHGENGARNGVGVVVTGMHTNGVWEVSEKRQEFWEKLDEADELISKEERLIIGADFNRHVGEGNSGDERVIGKYGCGAGNDEGQAIVDFAHRTDMAVINTFTEGRDCKVIPGESVTKQHHVVIGKVRLKS
ncbi:uncharacterized protein LOC122250125 [Penaeus japonicus]|uniref:uncharacterized protein LOC122250125 n=1 Tax=Penaeus japonicus TaxID=27405 RepID=UPI001C711DC6|nr:uncharacterized protein LOC122250125 [Penaeus japonicus]